MKCESVHSGMSPHIYKALLNRLNLDKFDTSSSNFYQHHNFYNILLSQQNTYKLDWWSSACCCRLRIYMVALSVAFCNFNTKVRIWYAWQTKRHDIIFFNYWIISSAGSLLTEHAEIFYFVKINCNYPQTTTQCDCFASCENIISWSQTSSLPPPPPPPFTCPLTFNLIELPLESYSSL